MTFSFFFYQLNRLGKRLKLPLRKTRAPPHYEMKSTYTLCKCPHSGVSGTAEKACFLALIIADASLYVLNSFTGTTTQSIDIRRRLEDVERTRNLAKRDEDRKATQAKASSKRATTTSTPAALHEKLTAVVEERLAYEDFLSRAT